jgi:hypothetical protein
MFRRNGWDLFESAHTFIKYERDPIPAEDITET